MVSGHNELAKEFNTTPVTICRSLEELAAEGVLHRKRGAGTFVGAAPRTTEVKRFCLVLAAEHLDDPQFNPEYWPYVQTMFRSAMGAAGGDWQMTTRGLSQRVHPASVAGEFANFDVAIFHNSSPPIPLMKHLIQRRIVPVAKLGRPHDALPCLTIDHDRLAGSEAAVVFLAGRGYRDCAFVGSKEWWGQMSLDGFRAGLTAAGLDVPAHRIARVGESRLEGHRGMSQLLAAGKRPEAVFVDADLRALGVLDALDCHGLRVPEDVAVISYDGLDFVTHHPPHLTTVCIPWQRIFATILERADQARGRRLPGQHVLLKPDIHIGRTTGWRTP